MTTKERRTRAKEILNYAEADREAALDLYETALGLLGYDEGGS